MKLYNYITLLGILVIISCTGKSEHMQEESNYPVITPDYIGVTIPYNIAPLNFSIDGEPYKSQLIIKGAEGIIKVKSKAGKFEIPEKKWRKLLENSMEQSLEFSVIVENEAKQIKYKSFTVDISPDSIDKYIAYRLIPPGYELWSKMGIYQRNLEGYTQTAIYENRLSSENCVNCHSFSMQNPDNMLFHMRAKFPGTILIRDGKIEKLNTKTDQMISALVYPSWHPSGDFVAFSVNKTMQFFHYNHKNRIEVYDAKSDVVVYDVNKHEVLSSPLIFSDGSFETFPTFSPDGKMLFFCTADSVEMPHQYNSVKYSLCKIDFDPVTRRFGEQVDTLFNAKTHDKSVSFPRVSPDGRFLVFTLSKYGNFSIWHKDADLWLLDLSTKEYRSMDDVNSTDVESYHSWSSNSRWLVFSSRRMDGLYTRPFFTHIDNDGNASKPFLLPQKNTDFYDEFMNSYNVPEFIKEKVENRKFEIAKTAKNDKGIDVTFNMQK